MSYTINNIRHIMLLLLHVAQLVADLAQTIDHRLQRFSRHLELHLLRRGQQQRCSRCIFE